MRVKILKLGHSAQNIDLDDDSTVEQAITAAGHDIQGYGLTINGLGCGPEASVADGDVVTLNPKVAGGR